MKTEKKVFLRTKLAINICVVAFLLNYLYSLSLTLVSEQIQGLTSLYSNIAYALAIGFPIFVLCGVVVKRGEGKDTESFSSTIDQERDM